MNRVELIRDIVDKKFDQITDSKRKRWAYLHTYGVSEICSFIALKKNLDSEIATIIGLLHDVYRFQTNIYNEHAPSCAEYARTILRDSKSFTKDESFLIEQAIYYHSDKMKFHSKYCEMIKDADCIHHHLFNMTDTDFTVRAKKSERVISAFKSLDIDIKINIEQSDNLNKENEYIQEKIADTAQMLANKKISGVKTDKDYMKIVNYFPEDAAFDELKNAWCAVFVYHCVLKAGVHLPIHIQGLSCRLACVAAWYEWAIADENNFYFSNKDYFIPQRGDIIIYDNIISPENKDNPNASRDHIGIVLENIDGLLKVAEGNINNENIGGITTRNLCNNIDGFIRLPNNYQYENFKYEYVGRG